MSKASFASQSSKQIGNVLKVGAVAERLGVSTALVRSLENLGFTKPTRSLGKYRLYTNDDLRVLRRAIYLRRVQGLRPRAILTQLEQEGLLNDQAALSGTESSIGPRLRTLRLLHGKSLSAVADAVGVSEGFLSNLERTRTRASVEILGKLAAYYGLNIEALAKPFDTTGPLVRQRDRRRLRSESGVHVEMLASGKISMEPNLFRIAPRTGSGEFCTHEGEEFLYLVRGRLEIVLASEKFELRAGDSFYFASTTQHRWFNPGKTEAVILWINTPPTF